MSTQSASSIPFSITHPQKHIRLLELPPELLAVVIAETDDDEADFLYNQLGGRIQLKSLPPTPTSTTTSSSTNKLKDQYLHLCTESKVWQIRQVSTSNAVHICQTSASVPVLPNDSNDDATTTSPAEGPGLTAFAQPTSTLELLPCLFTSKDAEAAIRQLLPEQGLTGKTPHPPPSAPGLMSEAELMASLPFPLFAVLEAKRGLFVIAPKLPNGGGEATYAAIPSPELLLAAWKCLFTIDEEFRVDEADMLGLGEYTSQIYMEEGEVGEVLACCVRAIAEKFVELEVDEDEEDEGDAVMGGTGATKDHPELGRLKYGMEGQLKGRETSLFVGEMLVRCAKGLGIQVRELEEKWTDLVPESWRRFCRVKDLEKNGCVIEGGSVRRRGDEDGAGGGSAAAATGSTASAAAGANKRNWHEKFAAQRKG